MVLKTLRLQKVITWFLTAAWLHKEYGFCELGMGTFALDYNLDINAEYTVGTTFVRLLLKKGYDLQ